MSVYHLILSPGMWNVNK